MILMTSFTSPDETVEGGAEEVEETVEPEEEQFNIDDLTQSILPRVGKGSVSLSGSMVAGFPDLGF